MIPVPISDHDEGGRRPTLDPPMKEGGKPRTSAALFERVMLSMIGRRIMRRTPLAASPAQVRSKLRR